MFRIELTEEERRVLIEALEADLSNLSVEISSTARMAYRDPLKQRREAMKAALGKLHAAEATASA